MPTTSQDKLFAETMRDSVDEVKMSNGTLGNAIDWISHNLNPDDVFSDKDLRAWAESNGYVKE
jgi:hypothetical protein